MSAQIRDLSAPSSGKFRYSVLALSVLCAVMSSAQAKTYENGFELAGGGE